MVAKLYDALFRLYDDCGRLSAIRHSYERDLQEAVLRLCDFAMDGQITNDELNTILNRFIDSYRKQKLIMHNRTYGL